MCNNSEDLIHYGWQHVWQKPRYTECVKDYIRSPFAKPRVVRPFPFVSECEIEFQSKPLQLVHGIPDCWAEVVAHNIVWANQSSSKNDSMHKEDVDIAHSLRKNYRLYIGQGIPDPWINYPVAESLNPPQFEGLKKEIKKYIFHLLYGKNKEEPCLCCEKRLLFECPDELESKVEGINSRNKLKCTCRECHSKDSKLYIENCKFAKILQNWALQNVNSLKESKRQKEENWSVECISSSVKNEGKPSTTCFSNADIAHSNEERNRKECMSESRSMNISCSRPKFCSCTCIQNFKKTELREKSTFTDFSLHGSFSKSVQTDLTQITKKEFSCNICKKAKSKKKCTSETECSSCGLYKCKIIDANFTLQSENSRPKVLNSQLECNCGKNYERQNGECRRKNKSKGREKEIEKDWNDTDGDMQGCAYESTSRQILNKQKCAENNKQIYYCYPSATALEHLKYITNNKLKYNFYEKGISLRSLEDRWYYREPQNIETSSNDKISKPSYYMLSSKNKYSESSCEDKFISPRKETTKLNAGVQTSVEAVETGTDLLDEEGSKLKGIQSSEVNAYRKRRRLANKRRRMTYRKSVLNKNLFSESKNSCNEDSVDCFEETPSKGCCYLIENESGTVETLNFCDGMRLEEYSKELEKRGLKLNLNKVYVSKPEFDVLKRISQQAGSPWSATTLKGIVNNFIDESQSNLKKQDQTTEI